MAIEEKTPTYLEIIGGKLPKAGLDDVLSELQHLHVVPRPLRLTHNHLAACCEVKNEIPKCCTMER